MKQLLLMISFSICSSAVIFAQELKDPSIKDPFTENSGNFLVLNVFNKIRKSDITIDYVRNLQQDLKDSKQLISEQQRQLNEQKRELENLKKSMDQLERQQRRELENLQRSMDQLERQVEDLRRKVK